MTVACESCQAKFRFDESRIPEAGLLARCSRCGHVFRMFRPVRSGSAPEAAAPVPGPSPAASSTSFRAPTPGERGGAPGMTGTSESAASDAAPPPVAPGSVPAPMSPEAPPSAGPPSESALRQAMPAAGGFSLKAAGRPAPVLPGIAREATPREEPPYVREIRRLARVVVSDLEVYDPRKIGESVMRGSLMTDFKTDLDEARRIVRTRYPGEKDAVEVFDRTIESLSEQRRLKVLAGQ